MYIEPFDDWTFDNALYKEPDLNFTWTVISFKNKQLLIQLKFFHPTKISPRYEPDSIVFHAKERTLFSAFGGNAYLHRDYETLIGELRRQLKENDFGLSSFGVGKFIQSAIVASLMASIVFSGLFQQIIGLVNSQQLIVHLPIFAVAFPANAMTFIKNLMDIVMFNYLGLFIGELDEEPKDENLNIPLQTQDLTYDSHSPTVLLKNGTLGAMFVAWVASIVAFALLRAYVLITGKGLNLHNKL